MICCGDGVTLREGAFFSFCNNGLALVVPEFLRYSMECMEHCDGL